MEQTGLWNSCYQQEKDLGELMELDWKEESGYLTQLGNDRREELKGELARLNKYEEISWRQKSRAILLKEGDNNTRFFHQLANSHRRSNFIREIEVDEEIVTGDSMKEEIANL